jgi:hypothetical protein
VVVNNVSVIPVINRTQTHYHRPPPTLWQRFRSWNSINPPPPKTSSGDRKQPLQITETAIRKPSFRMPPSPAPQNDGEIMQHGLHHVLQHNSNTSYPQQQYDEGVHLHSNYGSPAPTQDSPYGYRGEQARYPYQHQHQDSGLGNQFVRNTVIWCSRLQLTYARSTLRTFNKRCIKTNTAHPRHHLRHHRTRC